VGSIYDIAEDPGQDPSLIPSIMLIKFDDYTGPGFLSCPQGIVPVFSVTRQFDFKCVVCSRTQFPLQLLYAITIYRSQGLTLPKVGLNLNCREHFLGLSYVAVSRIKTLDGILFEGPLDFELLKAIDSATSRDRELDFIFRNTQLIYFPQSFLASPHIIERTTKTT
jgi:ATP-dependent DNA helicase PIF1